jgi:hypothetical protein
MIRLHVVRQVEPSVPRPAKVIDLAARREARRLTRLAQRPIAGPIAGPTPAAAAWPGVEAGVS